MSSYELLPLAAFVINIGLFAWVLFLKRKSALHRVFCAFLLSMALWGLSIYAMRTSPSLQSALHWDKLVLVILGCVVAFFLHFTYLYTSSRPHSLLLLSTYLLPILGAALYPSPLLVDGMRRLFYGYAPEPGILFAPFLVALHVVVFLGLAKLVRAHRRSSSPDERARLRYVIMGASSSIVGGITDYMAAAGLGIYPMGIIGNILFGLLTTVAILRLRLFDMVLAYRKGIIYSVFSAILLAAYGGAIVFINEALRGIATTASLVLNISMVLVVAVALHPVLRTTQSLVDRWFYRDRYDHLRALERFGLETKDVTDLQQLASSLINLITLAMRARHVHLLLPDRDRNHFSLVASTEEFEAGQALLSARSPLLVWLAARPQVLLAAKPDDLPFASSLSGEERTALEQLKGEIYVPLKAAGELSGLLLVGRKATGHPYSDEDLGLLQTVAHQASTAIRNSQLFAEAEARAREARQSERRYKNLLESATDAIFVLSSDSLRVIDANHQALALTGYSREELLSLDVLSLHMPRERWRAQELWVRTVELGATQFADLHIKRKDGSPVAVDISAGLIEAENEAVVLALARDITEALRAQEEFRKLHESVVQTNQELQKTMEQLQTTQEQLLWSEKMAAVGQLVAGVAHELNNPLTGIMGYAQLLISRDDVNPQMRRDLGRINGEAERAARIVHNLLSFARRHKPEKKPVVLSEILDELLELGSYDLKVNNIKVVKRYDPSVPPTMADSHQLQQVFLNIITNAQQSMVEAKGGGTLTVEAGVEEGFITVSFSDDGGGIEPQDLKRIFDPFFTTKPVGKGTGLGLSICYGIINEHGGSIEVQSSVGEGATFIVKLPIIVMDGVAEGARPVTPRPKLDVLVVDDEAVVGDLLQRLLTTEGHSVGVARNGKQALKALRRSPVDVIITDIRMPDMSGEELYARLLAEAPTLAARVIFTSGDAASRQTQLIVEKTGRPFLPKPFVASEIIEIIYRTCVVTNDKTATPNIGGG